jgi:hypothetical protein
MNTIVANFLDARFYSNVSLTASSSYELRDRKTNQPKRIQFCSVYNGPRILAFQVVARRYQMPRCVNYSNGCDEQTTPYTVKLDGAVDGGGDEAQFKPFELAHAALHPLLNGRELDYCYTDGDGKRVVYLAADQAVIAQINSIIGTIPSNAYVPILMTIEVRGLIEAIQGNASYKPRLKYLLVKAEHVPSDQAQTSSDVADELSIQEEKIDAPLKRQRKQTAPVKRSAPSKKLQLQRADTVPSNENGVMPVDIGDETLFFPANGVKLFTHGESD